MEERQLTSKYLKNSINYLDYDVNTSSSSIEMVTSSSDPLSTIEMLNIQIQINPEQDLHDQIDFEYTLP